MLPKQTSGLPRGACFASIFQPRFRSGSSRFPKAFPAWPAGFGDQTTVYAYGQGQFEYQFNNDTEHLPIKKISSGNTLHGNYDWAGVSSQYFGAMFIPEHPDDQSVVTLRNSIEAPASQGSNQTKPADVLGAAVGQPGETNERLFVGPKSLEVLRERYRRVAAMRRAPLCALWPLCLMCG